MTEYWVMRVVLAKAGRVLVRDLPVGITQAIGDGKYQLVNGDLVEPIACYEGAGERAQRQAIDLATAEHARTGCVHKVVMSADLQG